MVDTNWYCSHGGEGNDDDDDDCSLNAVNTFIHSTAALFQNHCRNTAIPAQNHQGK